MWTMCVQVPAKLELELQAVRYMPPDVGAGKPNHSPLQEQQAFLAAESSLHHHPL